MKGIKEALKLMLKDNEFDKIIKNAKGKDKKKARDFYEAIKDFSEEEFEKVPAIVFVQACKSYNVWQDIYCYLELVNEYEEQDDCCNLRKEK